MGSKKNKGRLTISVTKHMKAFSYECNQRLFTLGYYIHPVYIVNRYFRRMIDYKDFYFEYFNSILPKPFQH